MRKSKFSEHQIIAILKAVEAGRTVKDVCREHEISGLQPELERIAAVRGYPLKLRLDNGPELVSIALAEWAEKHRITLEFIKPGKPMQNGFIERFNRSYRQAVLDMYVFQTLNEAREQTSG
jgi:transposase InsO family protein